MGPPAPWQPHQDRELVRLVRSGLSAAQAARAIAEMPGGRPCSASAAKQRLHRLGIVRQAYWAPDEDRLLRAMAGRAIVPEIVRALRDECGTERSECAVKYRLVAVLGVPVRPSPESYLSTIEVARLFGMRDPMTITKLVKTGRIGSERLGRRGVLRIRPSAILAFIDAHQMWLDPSIMPPSFARNRVELVQRSGWWVAKDDAMAITGFCEHKLRAYRRRGILTATLGRMHRQGGGGMAHWYRLSELRALVAQEEVA